MLLIHRTQNNDVAARCLVEGQLQYFYTCCNNVFYLLSLYISKCMRYAVGKTNKLVGGGENRVTRTWQAGIKRSSYGLSRSTFGYKQ